MDKVTENFLESRRSRQALIQFDFEGIIEGYQTFGNGLINKTEKFFVFNGFETKELLLQKINHNIFKNVDGVMNNIVLVTDFIKQKLAENPKKSKQQTLTLVKTKKGDTFVKVDGSFYRLYECIENSVSFDLPRSKKELELTGSAFGNFHKLLMDFDASKLIESIPNFHYTPKRYEDFEEAVSKTTQERFNSAKNEISYAFLKKNIACLVTNKLKSGEIKTRVTHNDPKFNNVLFDKDTNELIAVIDLDTVMPGAIAYDFGDAVRSACNTKDESTLDFSNVAINLEFFEAFTKGYLDAMGSEISAEEVDSLVDGCRTITYELGLRFLADHLNGDTYFKTAYSGQNLDRAKVQFALLESMENNQEKMREIVQEHFQCEVVR